jgi:hypothetical protein
LLALQRYASIEMTAQARSKQVYCSDQGSGDGGSVCLLIRAYQIE